MLQLPKMAHRSARKTGTTFPHDALMDLERTLGRGNAALFPWVQCHGLTQGPCQALEAALGDMVAVLAVERLHMQGETCLDGERLEELAHQLGVEHADLLGREGGPEHQ